MKKIIAALTLTCLFSCEEDFAPYSGTLVVKEGMTLNGHYIAPKDYKASLTFITDIPKATTVTLGIEGGIQIPMILSDEQRYKLLNQKREVVIPAEKTGLDSDIGIYFYPTTTLHKSDSRIIYCKGGRTQRYVVSKQTRKRTITVYFYQPGYEGHEPNAVFYAEDSRTTSSTIGTPYCKYEENGRTEPPPDNDDLHRRVRPLSYWKR